MKKYIALALTCCMLLTLAACGSSSTPASQAPASQAPASQAPASQAPASSAAPKKDNVILTLGTGDVGGSMYPVGSSIAKVVNDNVSYVKLNVETSAGSPDNARMTQNGDTDFGLCTADVALRAMKGEAAFAGNPLPDLRVMFAMYGSVSQWMVLQSSGLEYVDQLAGKKASVGMTASATEIAAKLAIESAGIQYPEGVGGQFLGIGEGADAVRDNVCDAVHSFGGLPQGGFLDLSATKDTILLKYRPEHLQKILDENPFYYKASIPLDVYTVKNAEPVDTFGVKALFICNADADEEMIYDIVKAVLEHPDDLVAGHASLESMRDQAFVAKDLSIPLHPGAEKYFKEKGLI